MFYLTGFYGYNSEGSCLPGAARLDARNLTRQKQGCKPCDTNRKESQRNRNLNYSTRSFLFVFVERSHGKIANGIH